jgi:hypothetical protein
MFKMDTSSKAYNTANFTTCRSKAYATANFTTYSTTYSTAYSTSYTIASPTACSTVHYIASSTRQMRLYTPAPPPT